MVVTQKAGVTLESLTPFGSTPTKTGMIQRLWRTLPKDDMQVRETVHISRNKIKTNVHWQEGTAQRARTQASRRRDCRVD